MEKKSLTRNDIKDILASNDLSPLKKFGQNFLVDKNYIFRIADSILTRLDKNDIVYEIGPGLGSLTKEIISRGFRVKGFEIDNGFVEYLTDVFTSQYLEIIHGDALVSLFQEKYEPKIICGNLPYNVGTLLITRILESGIHDYYPDTMVFLLQKEVAERFSANEGDNNFSSLSVLTHLGYRCTKLFDVTREAFFPVPKVTSSLVRFEKKSKQLIDNNIDKINFIKLVRALFANKRKTIKNNLQIAGFTEVDNKISNARLTPNKRAEELGMDDFLNLFYSIYQ